MLRFQSRSTICVAIVAERTHKLNVIQRNKLKAITKIEICFISFRLSVIMKIKIVTINKQTKYKN